MATDRELRAIISADASQLVDETKKAATALGVVRKAGEDSGRAVKRSMERAVLGVKKVATEASATTKAAADGLKAAATTIAETATAVTKIADPIKKVTEETKRASEAADEVAGKFTDVGRKGASGFTKLAGSISVSVIKLAAASAAISAVGSGVKLVLGVFGGVVKNAIGQSKAVDRMKKAWGDLETGLAKALVPTISALANTMTVLVKEVGPGLTAWLQETVDVFIGASKGSATLGEKVRSAMQKISGALKSVAKPIASVVATFKLFKRVAETAALAIKTSVTGQFAALVTAVETVPRALVDVAIKLAAIAGDDETVVWLRDMKESWLSNGAALRGNTVDLAKQAAAALKAATSMDVLAEDYVAVFKGITDLGAAVGGATEKLKENEDQTRKTAAANRDLADSLNKVTQEALKLGAGVLGAGFGGITQEEFDKLQLKAAATLEGGVQTGGGIFDEFMVKQAVVGDKTDKPDGAGTLEGVFQTGGAVTKTGAYRLERGERVLSKQQSRSATVNMGGVTINGGSSPSLRSQARRLMPEIDRAARRGTAAGFA